MASSTQNSRCMGTQLSTNSPNTALETHPILISLDVELSYSKSLWKYLHLKDCSSSMWLIASNFSNGDYDIIVGLLVALHSAKYIFNGTEFITPLAVEQIRNRFFWNRHLCQDATIHLITFGLKSRNSATIPQMSPFLQSPCSNNLSAHSIKACQWLVFQSSKRWLLPWNYIQAIT